MLLKFLFRTGVGGVIALAIGLATQGPDLIPSLLLVIVCTAGVALLVLAPVFYLFGLAATIWFVPWGPSAWSYAAKRAEAARAAAQMPLAGRAPVDPDSLSRADRALAGFAAAALARGESVPAIRARLHAAGWDEGRIARALEQAGADTAQPPTPGAPPPSAADRDGV